MTDTTIPLNQLGAAAGTGDDGKRRDQYGRLLVVPVGGGKPLGYTRVTTVAKATDEGGGLGPWKATMTVCGALRHRDKRAKWEALLAAHESPWYATEESKAACKRLVEESAEAGGASDRRELGNTLHAITALVDAGQRPAFLDDVMAEDIAAYQAKLREAGVTVATLPHNGLPAVEVTVVLDQYKVGGSFDRLVNVVGHDLPMIADLKTGADIKYSDGAFAVQLSAYAHGEAIYEQGADPNGSTDERAPMPAVDQERGLIIWLPAGEARCELIEVDLTAGWDGFRLSLDVRRWRTLKGLTTPFSQWVPPPPVTETDAWHRGEERAREERARLAAVPDIPEPDPEPEPLPPAALDPVAAARALRQAAAEQSTPGPGPNEVALRAWLQTRIDIIGRHSPQAKGDLGRLWPPDMPTLKSFPDHSKRQLTDIEEVLDIVEARHEVPFGAPRPGRGLDDRVERRVLATFPGSTVTTSNPGHPA